MRCLLCFFMLIFSFVFFEQQIRHYEKQPDMHPAPGDRPVLYALFFAAGAVSPVKGDPGGSVYLLLLILISWIDGRKRIIPNRLNALILLLGLTEMLLYLCIPVPGGEGFPAPGERLLGMAVISLPFLFLGLVFPGGLGAGDIKLLAVSGFYLGAEGALKGAAAGACLGAAACLGMLLAGRIGRKDKIPFGPWLCMGLAAIIFVR